MVTNFGRKGHNVRLFQEMMTTNPNPTWTGWRDAPRVVFHLPYLVKTALTALVVGTVLFAINHLDEVWRGRATTTTWIKAAVTYLVPFSVANIGLLLGSRRTVDASQSLSQMTSEFRREPVEALGTMERK
jgi:hypothetical protein